MAAHAMAGGNSIAVVDGCNRFDVHALSRFARIRKIDPNKFLNRIFISRGFTCYQMEQAIAHKLPSFLSTIHSNTALIFGLLDTFYDEQASTAGSAADSSETAWFISGDESPRAYRFCWCVWKELSLRRNAINLFTTLKNGVDRVYKLDTNEQGTLQIIFRI